jgi:hypothetical protein
MQIINIIGSVLAIASAVFGIMISYNKIVIDSIDKKTKHKEFIKDILNEKNKVMKLTALKIYIGTSVDNELCKHIMKSPYLYEYLKSLKNIHYEVFFDETKKKIMYRNGRPNRVVFTILYFIFLIPIVLFISTDSYRHLNSLYGIVLLILVLALTPFSVYFAIEISHRSEIIHIVEMPEKNRKLTTAST